MKPSLVKTFLVGYGLGTIYDLYQMHVTKIQKSFRQAKRECKQIDDKARRSKCIKQKMAAFYAARARLEQQMITKLTQAHASPKKINVHKRRLAFYKTMITNLRNPAYSVRQAYMTSKRQFKFMR